MEPATKPVIIADKSKFSILNVVLPSIIINIIANVVKIEIYHYMLRFIVTWEFWYTLVACLL
jgi:hypothetical protein